MSLKSKLQDDLRAAMKSKNQNIVGVLRLLIAALNNKSIEKKGKTGSEELTDEETAQVLMSEAKKRKESIAVFAQGGREDLVNKEKNELEIIQKYLPRQLSREEIEPIIAGIVKKTGSGDFGMIMKEVMKELRGKADSALISAVVKDNLK